MGNNGKVEFDRVIERGCGIDIYKKSLVATIRGSGIIHRFLEDANIKLSSVISNLSGATATKIIDAMIGDQENVKELVKLRHGKMKTTIEDLALALTEKLTNHHIFMLRMVKKSIQDKALVEDLNKKIDKMLKENEMVLDAELLYTIPGIIRTLQLACCLKSTKNGGQKHEYQFIERNR
jgi:transposase